MYRFTNKNPRNKPARTSDRKCTPSQSLDNATKNMDLNGAIAQLKEISEKEVVEDGSKKVQQPRRNKSVSNKGN